MLLSWRKMMIEKPKRKQINRQDRKRPENIEQLIQAYDLDNIWNYIEKIIDELNKKGG